MTERELRPTRRWARLKNSAPLFAALALGIISPAYFCQAGDSIHSIDWKTEEVGGGRIQLDVRNTSRVPITAVLAEGKRQLVEATHPLLSVKSFDSALEPYAARSLESGQTYRFVFFGPKPEPARLSRRTVAVRAVLFADGGTWGDQEWIDTLLSLRRTAYRCENDALQAMQEAEMHPSIGEPILQKLDEMQKAEEGGARSVYDRIVIGRVFKEVITNIVGASQIEASLPHSFEPKKLAPSAPKMDSAIQATAYRIRSLKAAGLTSSM